NAFEDALQTRIVAFARQQVHLQEPLVGLLLNLDQVRNGDRSLNLREIDSFAGSAIFRGLHVHQIPSSRAATAETKEFRRNSKNQEARGPPGTGRHTSG